ncbi:MAG: hypothetical protein ABJQ71_11535, partial [Roseibium sp.]
MGRAGSVECPGEFYARPLACGDNCIQVFALLCDVAVIRSQTKEAISEREIQILQLEEDTRAGVLEDLQDVRSRIAQLEEQQIAALD